MAVALRSESLGECAEWPRLVEAINYGQFLIPRLTREELRSTIEGPLAARGGGIEPRLVARILEDITAEKDDRLPLMQHALTRLWAVAKARESAAAPQLRLEDYDRFGGSTRRLLSVHADVRGRHVGSGTDPYRAAALLFRGPQSQSAGTGA